MGTRLVALASVVGVVGLLALSTLGSSAVAGVQTRGAIQAATPGDLDWRSDAMLTDPGCSANTLEPVAPPDEAVADLSYPVDLPFEINHYGYRTSSGWITTDGSFYLNTPVSQVSDGKGHPTTDLSLTDNWRWDNVIAPMLGWNSLSVSPLNPDDAGDASITYGQIEYDGRVAFCINWNNVGYGGLYPKPGAFDSYGGAVPGSAFHDPANYIYWTAYDKTNSFQLVLVDRDSGGDGAYDIYFNYGSIQINWFDQFRGNPDGIPPSAYDAGVDFSAGWSAHNTFAWNSSGAGAMSRDDFEWERAVWAGSPDYLATILPPVQWSFWDNPARTTWLDGSTDEKGNPTGLARTSTRNGVEWWPSDGGLAGRHMWEVRPNDPAIDLSDREKIPGGIINSPFEDGGYPHDDSSYVALGDSFSSGQGTRDYLPGTNYAANKCHRSELAYPSLLFARGVFPAANFESWACSGAWGFEVKQNTISDGQPPWNDPGKTKWDAGVDDPLVATGLKSQVDRVDSNTRIVTLTVGGNDTLWLDFISGCMITNWADGTTFKDYDPCESFQRSSLEKEIEGFESEDLWVTIIDQIRAKAPSATVIVLGYPRLFPATGGGNDTIWGSTGCYFLSKPDQMFYNEMADWLNSAINRQAVAAGALYVDTTYTMKDHEICSAGNSATWALNGLSKGSAYTDSSHPNTLGHQKLADAVETQYRAPLYGQRGPLSFSGSEFTFVNSTSGSLMIDSGWTLPTTAVTTASAFRVASYAASASEAPPPGVVTVVTSPSGHQYTRYGGDGAFTYDGDSSRENFEIADAEFGEWTVDLYLTDSALVDQQYLIQYHLDPPPNAAPTGHLDLTRTGDTVSVDAAGSLDSDGEIVQYIWDFGDGASASGASASHTYTTEGDFLVTLVVVDDGDKLGYAYSDPLSVRFPGHQVASNAAAPGATSPTLGATSAAPTSGLEGAGTGPTMTAGGSPGSSPSSSPAGDGDSVAAAGKGPSSFPLWIPGVAIIMLLGFARFLWPHRDRG